MSLQVRASITAMAPGRQTSFNASGGTEPYVYSVLPDGAGGTIDPDTGVYTAPVSMNPNPLLDSDTIQVVDDDAATATAVIAIKDPLFLFCDIIAKELNLANDRVWIYNQKKREPTDEAMFVVVQVLSCKCFGNDNKFNADGTNTQSSNWMATLSLNVKSRSTEALLRKEEVLMALASQYSQSQQELNSFYIGVLPPGAQFVNLSEVDGAAIPYRFNISVNMQYFVTKIKAAEYFDDFADVAVTTEP